MSNGRRGAWRGGRGGISFLVVLAAMAAGATDFHLQDDRLWLRAENEPLEETLAAFRRYDVTVHFDPAIHKRLTAQLAGAPLEPALRELLAGLNYSLVWDVLPGNPTPLTRLSELRVFRPGAAERAVRWEPDTAGRLDILQGPDARGPWFVRGEILLGFRAGVSAADARALIAQIGGAPLDSLPGLGVYRIRVPDQINLPELVAQLKRHPRLAAVEPNYVSRLPSDLPTATAGQAGSGGVAAPDGPRLAVLDSGLRGEWGAVVGRYDALSPATTLADDPVGHGTRMAQIAAGLTRPAGGGADDGAALPLLAVRAFDAAGHASSWTLLRGLTYAMENGARVINLSWGTETPSDFLAAAVAWAQREGALVVAAAGNEPTGRPVYPAAYPGVIAVGATLADGAPWPSSNTGEFIALAAPGVAVFPEGTYAGTSIASVYVARQLTAWLQRHPSALAADAARRLREALTDAGPPGPDPRYGQGRLDGDALRRFLETAP